MMLRKRALFLLLLAAAPAGGACGTKDVELGDAVTAVNLSECYGAQTECGESDVEATGLLDQEPELCAMQTGPEREMEWVEPTAGRVAAAVVDATNVLWVVSQSGSQATVARFNVAGDELSSEEIDLSGDYDVADLISARLAVDVEGNAYLGSVTLVSTRADGPSANWREEALLQVTELDGGGNAVGTPMTVEGMVENLHVGASPDGSLLLSAIDEEGVGSLGKVGPLGELSWVQSGMRHGDVHALSPASDSTVVLGFVSAEDPDLSRLSLALYDENGNLAWERVPEGNGARSLVVAGDVIALQSEIERSGDEYDTSDAVLTTLGTDGEVEWAIAIDIQTARHQVGLSRDSDGNLYFADRENTVAYNNVVYQVDDSGTECTRSVIEDWDPQAQPDVMVHAAPNGALFITSSTDPYGEGPHYVGALAP
jgi:hypothetical protein